MTVSQGGLLTGDGRRPGAWLSASIVGLALLLTAAIGGHLFAGAGILVGATLVGTWLVAPPIVVLALGQLLFAALLPADASLGTVALVEAPLGLLVLGDLVETHAPLRTLGLGLATLTGCGALVVAGLALRAASWQVALGLVALGSVVSYSLHRYTVATLEATNEF